MEIRGGALLARLEAADLRSIRWGGREVLRRVYVAIRDRDWGTVPGVVRDLDVQQQDGQTTVTFDSWHQRAEIDFRWHGTIVASPEGWIEFTMDGRAHAPFLRNRIGFCVHHPLRECKGKKCRVETARGIEEGVFPYYVAPHQPFLGIRSVAHELAPGVEARVRFEGEIFEMEDHRNWTDGGYKIYGTPLSLPFPVEVEAGTRIRQSVRIELKNAPPLPGPRGGAVALRLAGGKAHALPRIGFGFLRPAADDELPRLQALSAGHLRVEAGQWRAGWAEAQRIGAELELAVTLEGDPETELRALATGLRDARVARALIYRRGEKSTRGRWVQLARRLLPSGWRVLGGTNAYFAELNRERPEDTAAGACFSVNPQVHAFDSLSLMENLEAQADVVESAKAFMAGAEVVVSPVTLLPRFNPDATSAGPAAAAPPADPRQREAFCAAWTAGSLKYLCEAGAASVTYYETVGPRGLLDGPETFPVYAVFQALTGFQGGEAVPLESADPMRVLAFALRKGRRSRLIAANLTSTPQTAAGLISAPLHPYEVRTIDGIEEVL